MITSNVNELVFKSNIKKDSISNNTDFLNNIKINDKNIETNKTDSFTYKNIKGISLEEIEHIFKNEADKDIAKNLRIATLFTEDSILGEAMFNTVLGKPFDLGYSYLTDRYEDKHNYFSSNKNRSLADLLHRSMTNKLENKSSTDVISKEYLDEILLEINSFGFLDAMSNTSKDQYNKYKDEDDYSFLYSDYNLQYQELIYKYEDLNTRNRNIIKQY